MNQSHTYLKRGNVIEKLLRYDIMGEQADINVWLEESTMAYNKMPQVVDNFEVDVEDID